MKKILITGARGPSTSSESTEKIHARLIFLSTDLVFDGLRGDYAEEDPPKGTSEAHRKAGVQRSGQKAQGLLLEQLKDQRPAEHQAAHGGGGLKGDEAENHKNR